MSPRVPPLDRADWDEETAEILARLERDGRVANLFTTVAHHPKLLKRWLVFGSHVLVKSTLPERDREMLILRTGWRCGSDYEFGQHTLIGRRVGLTDDDLRRIVEGPEAPGLGDLDRLLLTATDQLLDDRCLSDRTWQALTVRYDTRQVMDLVFTVGQYQIVSTVAKTLGVERDPGVPGLPEG